MYNSILEDYAFRGKVINGGTGVAVITVYTKMVSPEGLVAVKSGDPVTSEIYSTALFSAGPGMQEQVTGEATDLEIRWFLPS